LLFPSAAPTGDLTVSIETLPLTQADDALARQASRTVRGKLVLLVR
jgi:hypothetical protein